MNELMSWDRLINDKRFGLEDFHDARRGSRSDFQRDFDRLVFSSPFRRLQNKTQVFPLPGSVFVHNRLTHSMEVASVGRSLANEISSALSVKYADEPWRSTDLYFIDRIGLAEHLSPTRSNGLAALVKQMKLYAVAYKAKLDKIGRASCRE